MNNWGELKRLAYEVTEVEVEWLDADEWRTVMAEDWADFVAACTPEAILALIAENERLRDESHKNRMDFVDEVEKRSQLRAEVEELRMLLSDAADEIGEWGAYASEYFQEKHDLVGCVAKFRDALRKVKGND